MMRPRRIAVCWYVISDCGCAARHEFSLRGHHVDDMYSMCTPHVMDELRQITWARGTDATH